MKIKKKKKGISKNIFRKTTKMNGGKAIHGIWTDTKCLQSHFYSVVLFPTFVIMLTHQRKHFKKYIAYIQIRDYANKHSFSNDVWFLPSLKCLFMFETIFRLLFLMNLCLDNKQASDINKKNRKRNTLLLSLTIAVLPSKIIWVQAIQNLQHAFKMQICEQIQ